MKRIDWLVLREVIGPWLFGVAMFASLLIAATYLGRIADYVVQGVSGGAILQLTLLLLPAILVKTFAMAVLLATLLAFGKLSSDSEIVALRAAGASVYRIVAPVAMFSMIIAAVAFAFNEKVVPAAAYRSAEIMSDIATKLKTASVQPTFYPVVERGEVKAMVVAQDFSLASRTLRGVTIVAFRKDPATGDQVPSFYMWAKEMVYNGPEDWRIRGGATLLPADGKQIVRVEGDLWPPQIPSFTPSPEQLFAAKNNDNDLYSMEDLHKIITAGRATRSLTIKKIRDYEYGYWNKVALPLAAFIFGILGATLGISNARSAGRATGFAMAIAIIFAYFMLANFMNVWALGGVFPPYIASFSPIVLGLTFGVILLQRRNG